MKMLTGYLQPSSGDAFICGHSVTKQSIKARAEIGYLPESAPSYGEMQVEEFLKFAGKVRGLNGERLNFQIEKVLEETSLKTVRNQLIETLSKGYRQRVGLADALLNDPQLLVLDEPTNDLDLDTLRALEDFLDTWRGAVVIISHDRAFLDRTVDDVLVIDDGRARRWPGGYAGWLADREGSSNVRHLDTSGTGKGSASPRARSEVAHRSRSTVRHELKTAEKAIAKLETVVVALRAELEVAGTDHEAIARVGTELAAQEQALAAAEEAWLERSAELEEIDGVG